MKAKDKCFKILVVIFFGIISILAGGAMPVFGQAPPNLDGWLDDVYKSHGKSYSYSGFYLNANAILYIIDDTSIDPTYVYIAWVIDRGFNDASYGANKHSSWGSTGHTFFDLHESDKQRLDLENDCGEVVLDVTMDLLDGPGYSTPSGYQAVYNGADEDSERLYINGGDWTDMIYDTSLDANLNDTGYCSGGTCNCGGTDLLVDSPAWQDEPNYIPVASCSSWEYSLIWEMRIERTVFAKQCTGCSCLGVYQGIATNPVELHASPSKSSSPVTAFPEPGVIGNYIWQDINRDGVQDFNEPGIPNVTLALYTDPNGDGNPADGSVIETTSTDLSGYYAFLDVGVGNYIVDVTDTNGMLTGYSLTTGSTDPHGSITIDYGGEYLDADFGYAHTDTTKAVIGDFVWSDADNDGIQDLGEPGIGGVTIDLLADLDGDYIWDDVIATTTTTADGFYHFINVEPGDYKVDVTDTGGVLSGYNLTSGPHSSVDPSRVIRLAAGDKFVSADFGYNNASLGSIGNQVWLEQDKAGRPPLAGEPPDSGHGLYEAAKTTDTGIGDVTINLIEDTDGDGVWDTGERIIATTTTAADGTYQFNGLALDDYLVVVSDLNNVLTDYRKSLYYYDSATDPLPQDPTTDPTADNYSKREAYAVTLTAGSPSNQTADFGYWIDRMDNPGVVGDWVWYDLDADGSQDPGETGIEGVLMELYAVKNNGNDGDKLGEVYTDSSGRYLFSSLSVRTQGTTYRVKVAASNFDPGGPLEGYFLTTQGTPVPAAPHVEDSIALTPTNNTDLTLDFGYSLNDPGGGGTTYSIGDYVWYDVNEDGIQDATESGIPDVTLALYLDSNGNGTIDAGEPVIGTDTTDANGNYLFTGLVDGGDYIVQITDEYNVLTGYYKTYGNIPWAVTISGADRLDIDFGFNTHYSPTLALLSSFQAYSQGGQVVVHWETVSEVGTAGFYLLRQENSSRQYLQVNKNFLPGLLHSHQGGVYRYVDVNAFPGETYTYKLVEVELGGEKRIYGPFRVMVGPPPPGIDPEPMQSIYSKKPHKVFSPGKAARVQARRTDIQTAGVLKKSRVGNEAKITIKEKALYYLDAGSIANMLGMSPKQVAQKIKNNHFLLANQGQQIAYLPADGNSGIYFYGEGMDSLYTNENIYWLEKGKGLIMESVYGGLPAPANGNETFMDTLHIEEDQYALTALVNDPGDDYWMWDYIVAGSGGKFFNFYAPGAAAAGTASLTVRLQGATDTTPNPDHHVKVSLNGTQIGESWWDGRNSHQFTVSFNQSLITDGQNTVEIAGILENGVPYSIFYVNSFDLDYTRHYRAVNNKLFCRGDGNPVITIEGFTDSNINVFDVTEPVRPKRVTGTTIDLSNRVSFIPASPENLYLAVSHYGVKAPAAVFANKASDLKKNGNMADYVVIAPPGLEETALGLTHLRQGNGLETMVVELEDIYDEFNHGISSPEAIKEFLSYAYHNWNKNGPEYVVLAGEGTYDYKNYLGYGDNLVPPMLMKTPYGLFASDNWFADVKGNDGVPEIAIGRLPVMTAAELQEYIDKISAYEYSGGQWTYRVLMLADNPDHGGDFPTDSNYLANLFQGYTVETIHLPDFATVEEARQKVLEGFNNGAVLVNYIGHAGLDRLANEKLLWSGDVSSLQNGDRLPLMTAMTCIVGRFAIPGIDTLSEALVLKSNGGAVAVWAPTGASINYLARLLAEKFFTAAFRAGEKTLGKAVLKALADYNTSGSLPFMLYIYTLLGDPALEIK
ncbi:MAG: hypothetical protein JSV88_20360 [Candidatus Aminicenantes bacterium]|nr:MAG: hypothetical protein JSV88_20360 [Candidatus Aminicenantes bacterium]